MLKLVFILVELDLQGPSPYFLLTLNLYMLASIYSFYKTMRLHLIFRDSFFDFIYPSFAHCFLSFSWFLLLDTLFFSFSYFSRYSKIYLVLSTSSFIGKVGFWFEFVLIHFKLDLWFQHRPMRFSICYLDQINCVFNF
jgi:hypothetical protein